jgi:peptidoglycan/xylan/chitin deacetylase (PgdA/CDA1 family)
MKSLFPLAVFAGALSLLTGCAKIKALLTRKHAGPPPVVVHTNARSTPTPAAGGSPAASSAAGASGAVAAGGAVVPHADRSGSVACLCYHRFEPGKGELIINPPEFEAQMKKIKDLHLNVISMQDFLAWRRGEKSIPARSILISLDDGWISGYTDAWPILKKYNFPFTMFIYTDYVRGGPKSGGKSMSWEQLEQMRDAGVDIECHTVTHSDLRGAKHGKTAEQYADYLKNELVNSKDIIEQHLAIKVSAIAYPYGNYSTEVEQMCKQAGYEAAFTVNPQKITFTSPPYTLGRYAIDGKTPKVFDAAIDFGAGSSGPSPEEVAPMAASSMLTKPAEGETVHTAQPVIEANLQALGKVDPKSVEMLISGFGAVPAKYDAGTGLVRYQPTAKLQPKMYTVIVEARTSSGEKVSTRWNFSVDAR